MRCAFGWSFIKVASSQSSSAQADTFVERIVDIRPGEARALFWSWLYVFALGRRQPGATKTHSSVTFQKTQPWERQYEDQTETRRPVAAPGQRRILA